MKLSLFIKYSGNTLFCIALDPKILGVLLAKRILDERFLSIFFYILTKIQPHPKLCYIKVEIKRERAEESSGGKSQ